MSRETSPSSDREDPAARLNVLLDQAEALSDFATRQLMDEMVQTVLRLHGLALERLLQIFGQPTATISGLKAAVLQDELLRPLFMLHGLHSDVLATRVRAALEKVRSFLHRHGGDVEFVSLDQGVARLRLHGSCRSHRASRKALERAVRAAIEELCPDLVGFEFDGE